MYICVKEFNWSFFILRIFLEVSGFIIFIIFCLEVLVQYLIIVLNCMFLMIDNVICFFLSVYWSFVFIFQGKVYINFLLFFKMYYLLFLIVLYFFYQFEYKFFIGYGLYIFVSYIFIFFILRNIYILKRYNLFGCLFFLVFLMVLLLFIF